MIKVRQNLRKVVAIAICFAGSATMFAQETGVVINGVKWATRNVDKPGTFVTNPEDAGMFYQWNRQVGWSATAPMINSDGGINWDTTESEGAIWKKSNDPSPIGWRIPTLDEINKLLDTDKVTSEWTFINAVKGRRFTDNATGNSIFLPAAGYRRNVDGTLNYVGLYGLYWSSTQNDNTGGAYGLNFYSDNVQSHFWDFKLNGFSVRSVTE